MAVKTSQLNGPASKQRWAPWGFLDQDPCAFGLAHSRPPLPRLCPEKIHQSLEQAPRFPEPEAARRKHTCSCDPSARAKLSRAMPLRAASPALVPKGSFQTGPWRASPAPPIKDRPFILTFSQYMTKGKNMWISMTCALALMTTQKASWGGLERAHWVPGEGRCGPTWETANGEGGLCLHQRALSGQKDSSWLWKFDVHLLCLKKNNGKPSYTGTNAQILFCCVSLLLDLRLPLPEGEEGVHVLTRLGADCEGCILGTNTKATGCPTAVSLGLVYEMWEEGCMMWALFSVIRY